MNGNIALILRLGLLMLSGASGVQLYDAETDSVSIEALATAIGSFGAWATWWAWVKKRGGVT